MRQVEFRRSCRLSGKMKYWLIFLVICGMFVQADDKKIAEGESFSSLTQYWQGQLKENKSNERKKSRLAGFLEGSFGIAVPCWWENRLVYSANGFGSRSNDNKSTQDCYEPSDRGYIIEESNGGLTIVFESDGKRLELGSAFGMQGTAIGIACIQEPDEKTIVAKITYDDITVGLFEKEVLTWLKSKDFRREEGMFTGSIHEPSVELIRSTDDPQMVLVLGAKFGFSSIGRLKVASDEFHLLEMPQFGSK